ncbi:MAG: glucosaminidase domain-containing protein, partial [Candidatus Gastranaerophilales bacterium]|nr:glucosaminidase domain-containing protein [Candidatus Gastranaerophilales bacterium]
EKDKLLDTMAKEHPEIKDKLNKVEEKTKEIKEETDKNIKELETTRDTKTDGLNGEIQTLKTELAQAEQKEKTDKVIGDNSTTDGKLSEKLNSVLKGVLEGKADLIQKVAEENGVEPALLASIICNETGYGTSSAIKNKNNPGGLMDPSTGCSTLQEFSSLEDGLNAMASNLKKNYIDQGLTTPETIGPKYCPVGAANDPTGLNSNWIPGVKKLYNEFLG